MSRGYRNALAGFAVAALLATTGTALARATLPINESVAGAQPQKEKKLTAGEQEAKKLLRLMDKDQNGKVSKAEFMGFMEAEFDRLDKDKSGELDVRELTESAVRSSGAIHR